MKQLKNEPKTAIEATILDTSRDEMPNFLLYLGKQAGLNKKQRDSILQAYKDYLKDMERQIMNLHQFGYGKFWK